MDTTENTTPTPAPAPEPAPAPAPAAAPKPAVTLASLTASIEAISEKVSGFVGKLVSLTTRMLTPELVRGVNGWARVIGNYAVLLGIVLMFISSIVLAIRAKDFSLFAIGLGLALALVITHYAAGRFMSSSDKILTGTPGRISTMAFLECLGLLSLIGAIALFAGGIYLSIELRSFDPLIGAIIGTPLLVLTAAIALNPILVGVEHGEATAGEEAIGLLSFCLKVWLKLVPPLFCLLAIAGCIQVVKSLFVDVPTAIASSMAGSTLLLIACLAPILVYLNFIFFSLMLDLARAVLVIPGKIDNLKK